MKTFIPQFLVAFAVRAPLTKLKRRTRTQPVHQEGLGPGVKLGSTNKAPGQSSPVAGASISKIFYDMLVLSVLRFVFGRNPVSAPPAAIIASRPGTVMANISPVTASSVKSLILGSFGGAPPSGQFAAPRTPPKHRSASKRPARYRSGGPSRAPDRTRYSNL